MKKKTTNKSPHVKGKVGNQHKKIIRKDTDVIMEKAKDIKKRHK